MRCALVTSEMRTLIFASHYCMDICPTTLCIAMMEFIFKPCEKVQESYSLILFSSGPISTLYLPEITPKVDGGRRAEEIIQFLNERSSKSEAVTRSLTPPFKGIPSRNV